MCLFDWQIDGQIRGAHLLLCSVQSSIFGLLSRWAEQTLTKMAILLRFPFSLCRALNGTSEILDPVTSCLLVWPSKLVKNLWRIFDFNILKESIYGLKNMTEFMWPMRSAGLCWLLLLHTSMNIPVNCCLDWSEITFDKTAVGLTDEETADEPHLLIVSGCGLCSRKQAVTLWYFGLCDSLSTLQRAWLVLFAC